MTIRRMRVVCWITKATNTHSEHVILIAFPLHQWLNEPVSVLRYTYIACLVYCVAVTVFAEHVNHTALRHVIACSVL